MDRGEHVLNAVLLGVGLGVALEPGTGLPTLQSAVVVGVPVVLGALVPDLDVTYGTHRKTLHNLPTLVVFAAFPPLVGNLQWVWVGVLTHYVLDVLGSHRGIALFYPLSGREYDLPVAADFARWFATGVVVALSALEVAVTVALVRHVMPSLADGTVSVPGLPTAGFGF